MTKEIYEIIRRDECNTYVMSCYMTKDDLYMTMREDIKKLVEYISSKEGEWFTKERV